MNIHKSFDIENLEIIKKIGKGQFSTVFLVRNRIDENLFALKRIKRNVKGKYIKFGGKKIKSTNEYELKLFQNEVETLKILNQLKSVHFPKYYASEITNDYFYILQEYISNSVSLDDFFSSNSNLTQTFYSIIWQYANIFILLDKIRIYYTDFNVNNFLVTNDYTLKLVDFGFTCSDNYKNILNCDDNLLNMLNFSKGFPSPQINMIQRAISKIEQLSSYSPILVINSKDINIKYNSSNINVLDEDILSLIFNSNLHKFYNDSDKNGEKLYYMENIRVNNFYKYLPIQYLKNILNDIKYVYLDISLHLDI